MSGQTSIRPLLLIVFAIIVLITSWESNQNNIALADASIPSQSIRLRILANSDSLADQAMKRRIRDIVIEQMNTWVKEPDGIEQARQVVLSQLPAIESLVKRELALHGVHYAVQAELGKVPFPTKMYGSRIYPAGDYEALRITLGRGEGQNWWCVLFPPLCFVDAVSGEALASNTSAISSVSSDHPTKQSLQIKSKKQIHFYLWDRAKAWFS